MPRGGRRVGAGRKPNKPMSVVRIQDWVFVPDVPAPSDAVASDLAQPPEGMREAEAEVWRALAPSAIAQQTLIAATTRGFRELCEQAVLKQQFADEIARIGAAHRDADGLLRHYTKLAQRLDQSLARYRLTAQGKAEPSAQQKPKAANPWAS